MQTLKKIHDNLLEYRIAGSGNNVAIIFPGGHMDASVNLGEDFFIKEDYKIIILSRPGYGKTALSAGPSPDDFADTVAELCKSLGINKVVAVGISAGGRSAVRLAAKYPGLTEKLLLQCATSFMPWPDIHTRRVARIAFNPVMEPFTWWIMRGLMKVRPNAGLTAMLGNMTTLDPKKIIEKLTNEQCGGLTRLFTSLRSGKGFMNDLRQIPSSGKDVRVPTLIIHSKYDKSVSLDHAKKLQQEITGSELYITDAESHMIWFSDSYKEIQKIMKRFLTSTDA